jgi:hypothetical protein
MLFDDEVTPAEETVEAPAEGDAAPEAPAEGGDEAAM